MQIFNKSKRTFTINTGVLAPEKSIIVSDAEGLILLAQYEGEIIQIGNSVVEKENAELKAKIAKLEAGNEPDVIAPAKNKKHNKK